MANCKSCNARIIWAENINTKANIPLDADPYAQGKTRYRIVRQNEHGTQIEKVAKIDYETIDPEESTYVSHFETCPNAEQHSRKAVKP